MFYPSNCIVFHLRSMKQYLSMLMFRDVDNERWDRETDAIWDTWRAKVNGNHRWTDYRGYVFEKNKTKFIHQWEIQWILIDWSPMTKYNNWLNMSVHKHNVNIERKIKKNERQLSILTEPLNRLIVQTAKQEVSLNCWNSMY